MRLADKVVVITGGASGIGRAMATRFAHEGATVIVADIVGDDARRLASALGDQHRGLECDVSDEAHVAELITSIERDVGAIELFCANAGVASGADLQTPTEIWDRAFAVNVRAHIHAAAHLVPRWLERGRGYFLSTASAAGLLTQIGSAPYSVTKHAAVAFAEWLSITYGSRGIRVSCLCPMGVDTPMLRSDSPGSVNEHVRSVVLATGSVLAAEAIAAAVVTALDDERFLILPQAELTAYMRRKADDHERWLAGMRRLSDAAPSNAPGRPNP